MNQISIFDYLEQPAKMGGNSHEPGNGGTYSATKWADVKHMQAEVLKELNKIGKDLIVKMKFCKLLEPWFFCGIKNERNTDRGPYICFGYNKAKPKGIIGKCETILIFQIKGPTLGNTRAAAIRKIEEWGGNIFDEEVENAKDIIG